MSEEGFLPIPKLFKMHLRPFFNAIFHALSESVFIFFLSSLELEKFELKYFYFISKLSSIMNYIKGGHVGKNKQSIYTCSSI